MCAHTFWGTQTSRLAAGTNPRRSVLMAAGSTVSQSILCPCLSVHAIDLPPSIREHLVANCTTWLCPNQSPSRVRPFAVVGQLHPRQLNPSLEHSSHAFGDAKHKLLNANSPTNPSPKGAHQIRFAVIAWVTHLAAFRTIGARVTHARTLARTQVAHVAHSHSACSHNGTSGTRAGTGGRRYLRKPPRLLAL